MSALPKIENSPQLPARQPVRLRVNGQVVEHFVEPRTHLGDFVRDQCGLTGTHLGCEHGVCGACTLLVDGKPVRSCLTFAVACGNHEVTTIEGYGEDAVMARLRAAFNREHALQCGYCTPGMLATARDIVTRLPDADEDRIRLELSGNLCRCTGYVGIVRAIKAVLAEMKSAAPAPVVQGQAQAQAQVQSQAHMTAPMQSFTALDTAAAATAAAAASDVPAADAAENRRGWSRIESQFEVAYPQQQVWDFMADPRRLAACLPGAQVQEMDGNTVKGGIAIKFGPISASFNGAATLERDEANRRGMLRGAGTDSISHSRAKGDIGYRVLAVDAQRTRVEVTLEHMLQGPLAQFSRSGLVRDFVTRMVAEFGRNLEASMGGASADQLPVQKIGFLRMLWQVIVGRMKG